MNVRTGTNAGGGGNSDGADRIHKFSWLFGGGCGGGGGQSAVHYTLRRARNSAFFFKSAKPQHNTALKRTDMVNNNDEVGGVGD